MWALNGNGCNYPCLFSLPSCSHSFSSHVNKVLRFRLRSFIEIYSNIYNIQMNSMLASHTAIQRSQNERYQHVVW